MIPYGKHSIDQADIDAVVDVLENHFLTQGSKIPAFEKAIADTVKARFCTVVNSGTSALHVACLAAGVAAGDMVWTSPNSFVASANCALYCGASIDFIDIDPSTRNISVEALQVKLNTAKHQNALPKAIVVVHFAGVSCDMQSIRALTEPFGITLIEDAAHALGGQYLGEPVANCQYSDMAILSFHPVKAITSAEGGAITTNNPELAHQLQLFSKHGITRSALYTPQEHANEGWYYEQQVLGYNYRLSDLHAALGMSQLAKLPEFIEARSAQAAFYQQQLADLPVVLPTVPDYAESAWHLYVIELQKHSRKAVYNALKQRNIGVNVHYIPIHIHPHYQQLGFRPGQFPHAEHYYDVALTLPLFPSMSKQEQRYVITSLREVLI